MSKRYAVITEIEGCGTSTEYTELRKEERFSRKKFIKHIAQLTNREITDIKVLNVKRIA